MQIFRDPKILEEYPSIPTSFVAMRKPEVEISNRQTRIKQILDNPLMKGNVIEQQDKITGNNKKFLNRQSGIVPISEDDFIRIQYLQKEYKILSSDIVSIQQKV